LSTAPSITLVAILKNEADYIEEWLAFHILQGASQVILYDNNSSDDSVRRARAFAARVGLQVIPWPDSRDGFDLTQRLAYYDGACRLNGVTDYAAFIDIDEFLFASDGRTLPQALAGFPPEVGAIAINQRVFGSSGERELREGLVTARFTMAGAADHPEGHWFKSIARPARVVGFDTVHSVVLTHGSYVLADGRPLPPRTKHAGYSSAIAEGALRLNHYMLKSREEYERKKQRWVGQDLGNRYTDEYFDQRDRTLNAVRDERLRGSAAAIEALIASARAEAR
jgi:hypothetical protein